jgi:hypothetical protein
MRNRIFLILLVIAAPLFPQAQNQGSISGIVTNKELGTAINNASISLKGTNKYAIADSLGRFQIKGVEARTYTLNVSCVGYKSVTIYNVIVKSGHEQELNIQLESSVVTLAEFKVSNKKTALAASLETPLSIQKLTAEEIQSNPGGNFDISRVVQALPGVSGTAGSVGGYRNDIIIRGGAPSENVYYLDGIEVPVINHFSTQGSAGGPTGIINVNFIEEVKVSSSAFDAKYDNALSSVLQFKQRNGSSRKLQSNLRVSASEFAATFDGPVSKNTTFLASARRSYLQLLFKAIDLPIRPNYWDFQFKLNHKINSKTTLTFLGIGAIDDFSFAEPKEATPEKLYILGSSPSLQQKSYTVGASLKKQLNNGFWTLSASQNLLDNTIEKYDDNDATNSSKKRIGIYSKEIEHKLKFQVDNSWAGFKFSYGAMAQYVVSKNNSFQRIRKELKDANGAIIQPALIVNYNSNLDFAKYGLYSQASKRAFNNKLSVSLGIRTDMNSFTEGGLNPFNAISPRLSTSLTIADKWTLNSSIGQYYKISPYTILSYKDQNGIFSNQNSSYQQSTHYVIGTEFTPSVSTRFTAELFYKKYANMPVSIRDGISLSNLGGDFGVVGNEPVSSTGKGYSYGFEFFAQQKLTNRLFGTLSYTLYTCRFSGIDDIYKAGAWDNKNLISFIGGYKLKRNWEIGLKFRFQGGAPFTPFNESESKLNYLTIGTGLLDYTKLNSKRLDAFHSSDLRIDKKWNFKSTTLDLFLDITNWYNAKTASFPQYTFKRNDSNTAFVTTDGNPISLNGSNAIPYILNNKDGKILPTIGITLEF